MKNDGKSSQNCSQKLQTKDQAESFDDAKGLHESYASQRFTQDKAIRDIQDG